MTSTDTRSSKNPLFNRSHLSGSTSSPASSSSMHAQMKPSREAEVEEGGAVAVSNLDEFITELNAEEPELDTLLKNESYRTFAYIVGAAYPTVTWETSPWYFKMFFAIAWVVRAVHLAWPCFFIYALNEERIRASHAKTLSEKLFMGFNTTNNFLLFFQYFLVVVLLYYMGNRKKKSYEMKFKAQKEHLLSAEKSAITSLFKKVCYCLLIILLFNFSLLCSYLNYGLMASVISLLYVSCLTVVQGFIFFVYMQKFISVEFLFDDFLEDIRSRKVNALKYNANRKYVDNLLRSTITPFSLYLIALLMNGLVFVVTMYLTLSQPDQLKMVVDSHVASSPTPVSESSMYTIILMISIPLFLPSIVILTATSWSIASINEKSAQISNELADQLPISEANAFVLFQQTFNPIVVKLFGFLTIDKGELIAAFASYIISLISIILTFYLPT